MDNVLSKLLKDQTDWLDNIKSSIGDPGHTPEVLEGLNNKAYAMKMFCNVLESLDFKDFKTLERWL